MGNIINYCDTSVSQDQTINKKNKFIEKLKDRGHTCIIDGSNCNYISFSYVGWCQQDKCSGKIDVYAVDNIYAMDICTKTKIIIINPHMETKKIKDYAEELTNKGHTCIMFLESYPPQLCWCKTEPCNGNKLLDCLEHSLSKVLLERVE